MSQRVVLTVGTPVSPALSVHVVFMSYGFGWWRNRRPRGRQRRR